MREWRAERERKTEEIWDSKARVWDERRTTSFWRRKEVAEVVAEARAERRGSRWSRSRNSCRWGSLILLLRLPEETPIAAFPPPPPEAAPPPPPNMFGSSLNT